jgi:perosamine synthetase
MHFHPGIESARRTLADVTCFSFYATKTITTGEGGAAVTSRPDWADRMRVMSLHGISRDAWKRYMSGGNWYYEILAPGFGNLGDIAAALGLAQLARAEAMRARREAIAKRYDEAFCGEDAVELLTAAPDRTSAYHLYVIKIVPPLLDIDRNGFVEELRSRGVGVSVHFIPLHEHPYYRETFGYRPESLPVAHDAYLRSISLPMYSAMTDDQVERVIESVLAIIAAHRRRARIDVASHNHPVLCTGEGHSIHEDCARVRRRRVHRRPSGQEAQAGGHVGPWHRLEVPRVRAHRSR